jgi:hypothetical protein
MRMTKQQFDTAVDLIQRNPWSGGELDELQARIVAAACCVIKQRRGVPDDIDWTVPPEPELKTMVREFLAGLSAIQRKRLKQIAESLIMEKTTLH